MPIVSETLLRVFYNLLKCNEFCTGTATNCNYLFHKVSYKFVATPLFSSSKKQNQESASWRSGKENISNFCSQEITSTS